VHNSYSEIGNQNSINLAILGIVLVLLSNNPYYFYAYGQLYVQPTGSPCLLCFYTVEDKAIELGLTTRRNGTLIGHLNFDYTQPVNGNLTQTPKGLLYNPDKNFSGNDTFIIQLQNKSEPGNYSTTQVKIVVADSDRIGKGISADMILPYIPSISASIAGFGLLYVYKSFGYTVNTFKRNDVTKQIETTSGIIADLYKLEQQLIDLAAEHKMLEVEANNVRTRKELAIIDGKIELIEMKQESCINTFCNELEWIAFLILNNILKNNEVVTYLTPYFKDQSKNIFCNFASVEARTDKNRYTNMKQLYRNLESKELCK
jgi:hypothetical protein